MEYASSFVPASQPYVKPAQRCIVLLRAPYEIVTWLASETWFSAAQAQTLIDVVAATEDRVPRVDPDRQLMCRELADVVSTKMPTWAALAALGNPQDRFAGINFVNSVLTLLFVEATNLTNDTIWKVFSVDHVAAFRRTKADPKSGLGVAEWADVLRNLSVNEDNLANLPPAVKTAMLASELGAIAGPTYMTHGLEATDVLKEHLHKFRASTGIEVGVKGGTMSATVHDADKASPFMAYAMSTMLDIGPGTNTTPVVSALVRLDFRYMHWAKQIATKLRSVRDSFNFHVAGYGDVMRAGVGVVTNASAIDAYYRPLYDALKQCAGEKTNSSLALMNLVECNVEANYVALFLCQPFVRFVLLNANLPKRAGRSKSLFAAAALVKSALAASRGIEHEVVIAAAEEAVAAQACNVDETGTDKDDCVAKFRGGGTRGLDAHVTGDCNVGPGHEYTENNAMTPGCDRGFAIVDVPNVSRYIEVDDKFELFNFDEIRRLLRNGRHCNGAPMKRQDLYALSQHLDRSVGIIAANAVMCSLCSAIDESAPSRYMWRNHDGRDFKVDAYDKEKRLCGTRFVVERSRVDWTINNPAGPQNDNAEERDATGSATDAVERYSCMQNAEMRIMLEKRFNTGMPLEVLARARLLPHECMDAVTGYGHLPTTSQRTGCSDDCMFERILSTSNPTLQYYYGLHHRRASASNAVAEVVTGNRTEDVNVQDVNYLPVFDKPPEYLGDFALFGSLANVLTELQNGNSAVTIFNAYHKTDAQSCRFILFGKRAAAWNPVTTSAGYSVLKNFNATNAASPWDFTELITLGLSDAQYFDACEYGSADWVLSPFIGDASMVRVPVNIGQNLPLNQYKRNQDVAFQFGHFRLLGGTNLKFAARTTKSGGDSFLNGVWSQKFDDDATTYYTYSRDFDMNLTDNNNVHHVQSIALEPRKKHPRMKHYSEYWPMLHDHGRASRDMETNGDLHTCVYVTYEDASNRLTSVRFDKNNAEHLKAYENCEMIAWGDDKKNFLRMCSSVQTLPKGVHIAYYHYVFVRLPCALYTGVNGAQVTELPLTEEQNIEIDICATRNYGEVDHTGLDTNAQISVSRISTPDGAAYARNAAAAVRPAATQIHRRRRRGRGSHAAPASTTNVPNSIEAWQIVKDDAIVHYDASYEGKSADITVAKYLFTVSELVDMIVNDKAWGYDIPDSVGNDASEATKKRLESFVTKIVDFLRKPGATVSLILNPILNHAIYLEREQDFKYLTPTDMNDIRGLIVAVEFLYDELCDNAKETLTDLLNRGKQYANQHKQWTHICTTSSATHQGYIASFLQDEFLDDPINESKCRLFISMLRLGYMSGNFAGVTTPFQFSETLFQTAA